MDERGAVSSKECRHERGHIIDSRFHGSTYSTAASRRIFCDMCRMQRWLDVEAALAISQAELGIIPSEAAAEIVRTAQMDAIDVDRLCLDIKRTAHSLVSLLTAFQECCPGAGEFVHYGTTTQDIQDTAQSLEMADVLVEVEHHIRELVLSLVPLAQAHRDTLMTGRTHAQPAAPITFGLKVAGWIDELLRQAQRLEAMKPRVLVAQLFGAVGTMAGFSGRGPALLRRFAQELSLEAPIGPWHVARDRVAEYVTNLAMTTATLGRITDEVRTLSRPEFGELEENWEYGTVGSSTMPHKRNPERCEQVIVLARLSKAMSMLALESMIQQHERDTRGLRLEWVAVADASHYTLAALELTRPIVAGLNVHASTMAANASELVDTICSERLMLALAPAMGKQSAHALVYKLSQNAQSDGLSLREVIAVEAAVQACLTTDELANIFDPMSHLGSSGEIVDETVATAEQWLARAS